VTSSTPACLQSTELTKHFKVCFSSLRVDTLQRVVDLVLAIITAKKRQLLRSGGPDASLEAKKRRVERALHGEQLTMQVFLALLLVHLPPGKVLMSLDRTT